MPLGLFGSLFGLSEAQRQLNQRSALAQQAAAGSSLGLGAQLGGAIEVSGFQDESINGLGIIQQISMSGSGNFNTWIRGLEVETEINRFKFLICKKKNAADKLEFRRRVGILKWMEVVKDYNDSH